MLIRISMKQQRLLTCCCCIVFLVVLTASKGCSSSCCRRSCPTIYPLYNKRHSFVVNHDVVDRTTSSVSSISDTTTTTTTIATATAGTSSCCCIGHRKLLQLQQIQRHLLMIMMIRGGDDQQKRPSETSDDESDVDMFDDDDDENVDGESNSSNSDIISSNTKDDVDIRMTFKSSETTKLQQQQRSIIYNGSFKDALQYAKQHGSLLIVFIPQKPISSIDSQQFIINKNNNDHSKDDPASIDNAVLASFLSSDVAKKAQQSPPKSKKQKKYPSNKHNGGGGGGGSFVLWYCSNGMSSSEATNIIKRIRGGTIQMKNAAGQRRPILIALFPHTSVKSGTLVPQLLGQHHCSPPPTIEKFVEWLQTIRIRNKKYYVALQKQIQEIQWYQERQLGYQTSIQSDIQIKEREKQQEQERLRKERELQEEKERIEQRRAQLLKLVDAVTVTNDIGANRTTSTNDPKTITTTTIALRFSDGRTNDIKRTFNDRATIMDIFYWIDAVHAMPYETVTIQTMNGKRSFVYNNNNDDDDTSITKKEDTSLMIPIHTAGLGNGKMIGLRVFTRKPERNDITSREDS